uniref:Uncharacterized protein n=1 Tax=Moniliophthora roreri TaxID=221103 RepID=A0A0W0G3V6_MONRR
MARGKNKGGRPAKKAHNRHNISELTIEDVDNDISAENDLMRLAKECGDLDEMDWFALSEPDLVATDEQAEEIDEEEYWEDKDWDKELADEKLLKKLLKKLAKLAKVLEDDKDWVPVHVQAERQCQKKRLKGGKVEYKKSPDVTLKSEQTQCRYQKEIRRQTNLNMYFNPTPLSLSNTSSNVCQIIDVNNLSEASSSAGEDRENVSRASSCNLDVAHSCEELDLEPAIGVDVLRDVEDKEEWELEREIEEAWLSSRFKPRQEANICGWDILRDQIVEDLKKHKSLPLSQFNQLLIL